MREGFLRIGLGCIVALLPPASLWAQAQEVETRIYTVAGLSGPAEILVDEWGVPHIYAETQYDAFFVQGFNAARDRLWQLDIWRRRGLGELSEVLGPAFVEQDRAARLFLYRGDMYSEWLAYGSDAKRIATSFAAGVNAYIALTRQDPELLPWEFEFLDYAPAFWSPEDTVRIRSHGLVRNVGNEVRRALFVRDHGLEADALRAPLSPVWKTTIPEGLDIDAIPEDVLRVYRLATRGVSFTPESLSMATTGSAPLPDGMLPDQDAIGSNNWVVSPRLTATGRPILANDPHRGQSVPSLRYLVHLVAPGLNVIGAGEPALPGVSIGHNERIAFGLTIFSIDQEDLYVYSTSPANPDEYRYRDTWESMEIIRETISVKSGAPESIELKFTRHGPVIYEDRGTRTAFAVRAAWLEPGMAPYFGSVEYMRASNWDEFLAAMNRWGAPSENQVYADVDGNIGWKPGGRAPIRPNWDGLLPVPGDGRFEWDGFWDMDQLPVEHNPARGWSATANEMNLPEDYPYRERKLGFEWSNPSRKQRISQVLSASSGVTMEDMLRLQTDHVSVAAHRVLPVLEGISSPDPAAAAALELLAGWDMVLENDSAAAALFTVWFGSGRLGRRLLSHAVSSEVAAAIGNPNQSIALEMLESPQDWFDEDPSETVERAILESLSDALGEMENQFGRDPSSWRYGAFNTMGLRHPLSEVVETGTRARIDIASEEKCSAGGSVGTTRASWRQILDVGNWDAALAMSNPGQSGDPDSPFYRNLWDPWRNCEAFPLLYSRDKIDGVTKLRIELEPRN